MAERAHLAWFRERLKASQAIEPHVTAPDREVRRAKCLGVGDRRAAVEVLGVSPPLELQPHVHELPDLGGGELGDVRSDVRNPGQQSFVLELRQRLAQGDLADAELGRHPAFDQPFSRLQIAPQDRLPDARGHLEPERDWPDLLQGSRGHGANHLMIESRKSTHCKL